ncbi:MAG: DedA family protein [Alphaproteobacteria bacterium]|nr:DedA family protein [Alphaproteobacteria bacterium]
MKENTAAALPRTGAFRRLYHWIMRNAEGPYAYAALACVAFAEASFFPMIPDIVMAPMIIADRRRAVVVALWCTLWSVVGGAFGYALGSVFFHSVGHWLVAALAMGPEVDILRTKFAHNAWIILVMGLFTPFKLISISSGIAAVPFPVFILYTSITRTVRFFAVAGLLYVFGSPVRDFLERWLEYVLVGVLVLIVAIIVVLRFSLVHLG